MKWFLLSFLAPALALASTSPGISHHGRLLDANDQPVNGVLGVTFTLYDAPSAGNVVWSEGWSITFVNGHYSVLLGGPDGDPPNPIDPAQLDRQLYLGIQIGDGPELQPRQTLGASVYALRAAVADSVVGGTLSGVTITGASIDANSLNIRGAPLFDENGQWVAEPGLVPFVTESQVVLRTGDQDVDGALTADRFVSTDLAGPPLEVASDALVLNLNAEYVGGRRADELVGVDAFAESGFLNLALNGSFERGDLGSLPAAWQDGGGNVTATEPGLYGTRALTVNDSGDGTAFARQVAMSAGEVAAHAGRRFTASVWARWVSGDSGARLCLLDGASVSQESCSTAAVGGSSWQRLSVTHTVSESPVFLEARLGTTASGTASSWEFDGFIVSEGPLVRAFAPHVSELVEGGAVDGDALADGAVSTQKLADGSVTREKLAVDAVDESRIADGAVTGSKLAAGAVDSAALAAGAVTSDALDARAVTTSALDDQAVTSAKLGDGAVTSDKLGVGAVGPSALADDAVGSIALADGSVTAAKLAPDAVGVASIADGSITREKLALEVVDAAQLAPGAVRAGHIASTAVGNAALADGAVTTGKLFDGAVIGSKIGNQAVGSAQIADGAVNDAKLASDAVKASHVADGAIGTTKLANDAVTSLKLAPSAVTETRIAASAVSSGKLQDGAVTEAKLGADSVTSPKIASGAVNENAIDTGAVTASKLGPGAVTTPAIDDEAVTEAKLGPGAVTAGRLGNGAVIESKIGGLAVTEGKIAASAITADKLATGAVKTEKLGDGAVTTAKLGPQAVTVDKLSDLAVTADKLANGAVTTAKIGDDQITTNKLGNLQVTGAKIADGTISGGKLANLAVGNAQLADGAVTSAKIAANTIAGDRLLNLTVTGTKIAEGTIPASKLIDGAGTGLDADLLDGHDSAAFMRTNANTSTTGTLTVHNDATVNGTLVANRLDGVYAPRQQNVGTQTAGALGAAIYNDGASYEALVIQGNSSSGSRWVRILDHLRVSGHLVLDSGGDARIYTGTGPDELNRYLSLFNSPDKTTASGLRTGGLLVADTYAHANPGKNDAVIKGTLITGGNTVVGGNATVAGNLNVTGQVNSRCAHRLQRYESACLAWGIRYGYGMVATVSAATFGSTTSTSGNALCNAYVGNNSQTNWTCLAMPYVYNSSASGNNSGADVRPSWGNCGTTYPVGSQYAWFNENTCAGDMMACCVK